ncbi:hypothetical protein MferCBS31731_002492 [Microsporum ferrugineum]
MIQHMPFDQKIIHGDDARHLWSLHYLYALMLECHLMYMLRGMTLGILKKFKVLLLELKNSEQRARDEVHADEIARKLPLGDEGFLQLLKTPISQREEWINSREGRLQLLTPVERLFQSEFRQFTVSTLRWPGDEEYTTLSREISYGKCQPLYGKGPGGQSLFNFDSNEAWEALEEERAGFTPKL